MKRFLIFLFLFLFSLPAFGEYVPISEDKQAQYKAEVEQYIDKQVPIAKREMDKEYKKSEKLYTYYVKSKNKYSSKSEYIDKLNYQILCIQGILFDFYIDLINITKKYDNIENLIPATGFAQELDLFISPYLEECNVINISRLAELYA